MVKNQIENCKYDEDYCCECISWTDLIENNCKCHDPNRDRVATMIAVTSVDPSFENEDFWSCYLKRNTL